MWDNKRLNVCCIKIPGEKKECDAGKIFEEIMIENFPKFGKGYKVTHSRS